MKSRNTMLALGLMIVAGLSHTLAQSLAANLDTYKAYLTATTADAMHAWETVVANAQSDLKQDPASEYRRFNLALAQYGLLNGTMRAKDESLFNRHVDATIDNLEAIKGDHNFEAQALLAGVYGLQMAYSPSKGMFLGPKTSSLLDKARKGDPKSALIWKLYANSKLHTPEAYGGDVGEAIESYEKAIALYEGNTINTKDNWLYLDALAFLGQAYVRKGETSKAIAVYEKALTVEPNFGWVKYNLLPAAQKSKP
jgi:tetratricopeptide (TPR) repeat protein